MPEDQERIHGYKYLFRASARGIEGGFTKISGVSEEIEVVDKRDGVDPFRTRKIKGAQQGGQVTLERGLVKDRQSLFNWFRSVKEEDTPYWSNILVSVYAAPSVEAGNYVAFFTLFHAWPNRYEIGELNAKSSEIEVETLSVVHEGIDMQNF